MINRIRQNPFIAIVILVIIGFYFFIVNSIIVDSNKCDEQVILNDNTKINAKRVSSYDSGITNIKTCNDEIIKVPTINIRIIKQIDLE